MLVGQVRVRVRDRRAPLDESKFRPYLFHYDGPKFRFELSQTEVGCACIVAVASSSYGMASGLLQGRGSRVRDRQDPFRGLGLAVLRVP